MDVLPNINALRSKFGAPASAAGVVRGGGPPRETKRSDSIKETGSARPSSSVTELRPTEVNVVATTDPPERLYETTNHTQRFNHTRAMFAKMEEQTLREKELRRSLYQRSKSPTRFQVCYIVSTVILLLAFERNINVPVNIFFTKISVQSKFTLRYAVLIIYTFYRFTL